MKANRTKTTACERIGLGLLGLALAVILVGGWRALLWAARFFS
jgi:hypothetical protein